MIRISKKAKKIIACAVIPALFGYVAAGNYALNVNAAGTQYQTLNISQGQIPIGVTTIKYGAGMIIDNSKWSGSNWSTSGNMIKNSYGKSKGDLTSSWTSAGVLRRYNVSIDFELPKSTALTPEKFASNVSLAVKSDNTKYSTDHQNSGSEQCYTLTGSKSIDTATTGNVRYTLKCTVVSYGDSLKYTLKFNNSLRYMTLSMSTFVFSAGDIGYTYVETKYNGENLYASIPHYSDVTGTTLRSWAERTCMLINSVSDITGIKHGMIYYVMEDPLAGNPNCDHFVMSNDAMNAVIRYPVDYSKNDWAKSVKNGVLDWGEMHETSHCYSFTGQNKTFASAYNYNLDDVNTNVRGITALQNCEGLRNVSVDLNGVNVGTYTTALKKGGEAGGNNYLFKLIGMFGRYVENFPGGQEAGWDVIEKYLCAYDNPTMTNDMISAAMEVFQEYKGYGGSSEKFASADTYRFINGMHYLSKARTGSNHTKENFKTFLKDSKAGVGTDLFYGFIQQYANKSDLGEAPVSNIKGDINADGYLTSEDKDALNNYFANRQSLTPDGIFNADINVDGYINQADKESLNTLIK